MVRTLSTVERERDAYLSFPSAPRRLPSSEQGRPTLSSPPLSARYSLSTLVVDR
ncbi:MAG: hypothetical protein ACK53Y_24165 [bacterium]